MFENIVLPILFVVLVGIVGHWAIFGPRANQLFSHERNRLLDPLRYLLLPILFMLPEQRHNVIGVLRKLAYILGFVSVVILGFTGFWPNVVHQTHISGYTLMIHATFGPVFAACMAFLTVFWADKCRFDRSDCPAVQSLLGPDGCQNSGEKTGSAWVWQKILFWLVIALSPIVIMSIVLTMFDLAGTDWQNILLELHRYSSLAWVAAAILHAYSIALFKSREIAGLERTDASAQLG